MNTALIQLVRDAFADQATDVVLMEEEAPRIRREGTPSKAAAEATMRKVNCSQRA